MKVIDKNHKSAERYYHVISYLDGLSFEESLKITDALRDQSYKINKLLPKDTFIDAKDFLSKVQGDLHGVSIGQLVTRDGIDFQLSKLKDDAGWIYFGDYDVNHVYLRREWVHVVDLKVGH